MTSDCRTYDTDARQHGIIVLTQNLAFHLEPLGLHGITVNAIAPSLTLSDRLLPHRKRRFGEGKGAELTPPPLEWVTRRGGPGAGHLRPRVVGGQLSHGVTIDGTGGRVMSERAAICLLS
jgi:NAD(P)-dependent dehydrogenase (short-subunit alcohol dehydrogenase family)